MSKKHKKEHEQNKISLFDTYKAIFDDAEAQGIDIDSKLKEIGGKDKFLQGLQDLDDDVVNDPEEVFKEAYAKGNIRRCVRAIYNIAWYDWFHEKRGLKRILYSEDNLLKNPLHYSFTNDDYQKTRQILVFAIKYLDRGEFNLSDEMAKITTEELVQLVLFYECIYTDHSLNEKKIEESRILEYKLPQIIQSWLVFYQSQDILLKEEVHKRWKGQEFITGFESRVASEDVSIEPGTKVSIGDSIENLLEDMDALFRYVFYLKGKSDLAFSKEELEAMEYISPYDSYDYALLDAACNIDVSLNETESRFRYCGWEIGYQKDPEVFGFSPVDEQAEKVRIASNIRHEYNFMLLNTEAGLKSRVTHPSIFEWDASRQNLSLYIKTSERLNIDDLEDFHFNSDEYTKIKQLRESVVEVSKKTSKDYYLSITVKGMSVGEFLDAYLFLFSLSEVYLSAAKRELAKLSTDADQKEFQKKLVPIISLGYLYTEFARLSGYDVGKAEDLINCYVFDENVSSTKKIGDIFTRPLIKAGEGCVFLSEALLDQMNLDRNIEKFLDGNDLDLAPVGKELEKKMISSLAGAQNLHVNTNAIEFAAFDGKNVEFDFLATIDDYLIIMELKSFLRPYDNEEVHRRYKHIDDGIKQVKRRVDIVQKDWNKIKELADIDLPDKPYDNEHIIKIVCSDDNTFTGLINGDVILTDDATVIKYFTNPYTRGVLSKPGVGVESFKKQTLWKKGYPKALEFIEYLHDPDTINFIVDCIKPEWKPIPYFEGYKPIAFKDHVLAEDPWKRMAKKNGLGI